MVVTELLGLLADLEGTTSKMTEAVYFECGPVDDYAARVKRLADRISRLVDECDGDCTDRLTGNHANRRLS